MPKIEHREVSPLYRPVFERASKSRAAAMKAMCLQCVNYVRQDVADCTDDSCPLWTWRPYQHLKR